MPEYQWAVGKGRLVMADYDRSMALSAEQVKNELRAAINSLFDGADVSAVNDEFKEVYKIVIPREEENQIFLYVLKERLLEEEVTFKMNSGYNKKQNI